MRLLSVKIFFIASIIFLVSSNEAESQSKSHSGTQFEIAFMPDVHFHDVFADFEGEFEGLLTDYKGENRHATIRTMQAQLTSTRLFNENYFAFIAALDDAANRGIKIIALPGDFSDDGQPVHLQGLVEILERYRDKYDLQFFVTPGNHDPTRPFTTEAGKNDYLGHSGRPQPIFSFNHPNCINRSDQTNSSKNSKLPTPHDVACMDQVKELGYSGLFELLSEFGLTPKDEYFYYETPFSSYQQGVDSIGQKKKEFGFEDRQYEICREGSGGSYREEEYTLCTEIMDMSYLVEPVEDLWLLAIDANVYIPQGRSDDSSEVIFTGSGNTGYNKLITHKKHLLPWLESVARRAEKDGKSLIAFSHFPAADFYNGAAPKIEKLWGKNEFQLARMPKDSTSRLFAETGIKLHIAGHMHMNGTSVFRDSVSRRFMANIQAPSLAAYVPAYKIVRITHQSDVAEVETVIMDEVPDFDTLFPHYREEWNYLHSIDYPSNWNLDILNSKTYSEYTNWHIRELSRLRFLPREWPEDVRALLSGMTGRDMLIATQIDSSALFKDYKEWLENNDEEIENMTTGFSHEWVQARKKSVSFAQEAGYNLSDFENWDGEDLSVDFYRLRNAGELAIPDITEGRMNQYLFIAKILSESSVNIVNQSKTDQQFHEMFKDRFRTVFDVLTIFRDRLPDNNFQIDLETGEINNINIE
ncbi:MAG: metallophosphoesterase [Balneolaceae bacterium]|nr:metallophosphoesterase [Balneolaceae bacterium]